MPIYGPVQARGMYALITYIEYILNKKINRDHPHRLLLPLIASVPL